MGSMGKVMVLNDTILPKLFVVGALEAILFQSDFNPQSYTFASHRYYIAL